jgi:hypothetical protein
MDSRQYLGYFRGVVVLAALVAVVVGIVKHTPTAGFGWCRSRSAT